MGRPNVHRAAFFGRHTTCPINVVHLSSAAALDEVRRARRDGARVQAVARDGRFLGAPGRGRYLSR